MLRGYSYIVPCWGVVQLGGQVPGLSLVGPAKVKAGNFFLFTEGSPKVENKCLCDSYKLIQIYEPQTLWDLLGRTQYYTPSYATPQQPTMYEKNTNNFSQVVTLTTL